MSRKLLFILSACVLIILLSTSACSEASSTSTSSTNASTSTLAKTTTTPTTAATSITPVTTIPKTTTVATTIQPQQEHWWDKFGEPQYGGELVMRAASDMNSWDPYNMGGNGLYCEALGGFDRTVEPTVCNYTTGYFPPNSYTGWLVESWESTDWATITVRIHQGVKWWDKAPVNGRELTADDIIYNYHRMMGTGNGFTKPSPWFLKTGWLQLDSITATDKYTIVFKFKTASMQNLLTILEQASANWITTPEDAVAQYGTTVTDYTQLITTGPYIVTEHVTGSSYTMTKNPNYWRYDDRWPENKLPYIDTVKTIIIPDIATAVASLRSGRLDLFGGVNANLDWQQSETMKTSNPEITQIPVNASGLGLQLRVDRKPFDDIRVRKAMQMAIDVPTIANSYYHSVDPTLYGTAGPELKGVYTPFDQWPQEIKDGYTYNLAGAKALLVEAGYPNGFDTNCVVDSASDLNVLQVMKAYLSDISIDMEIKVVQGAAGQAIVSGKKYDQMVFSDQGVAENTPLIRLAGKLVTGYVNNQVCLADPAYDQMYDDWMASTNWDDFIKRANDIDNYVIKTQLRVVLPPRVSYTACQTWVKGFNGEINSQQGQYHIPFYWIDQTLKK
jgi:peptide/nickel transport system substrate-binding protein